MKSQKTAEESHNKENIKNPRGFIVLQTQFVSYQNEIFLPDTIDHLLTKLVRS